MKRISYIILSLVAILILSNSCSKDDQEDISPEKESPKMKWELDGTPISCYYKNYVPKNGGKYVFKCIEGNNDSFDHFEETFNSSYITTTLNKKMRVFSSSWYEREYNDNNEVIITILPNDTSQKRELTITSWGDSYFFAFEFEQEAGE